MRWVWRRRKHRETVIPRRPELKRKKYVELSNPCGIVETDLELIEGNKDKVMLAHCLGLDLALHRGGVRHEWLVSGMPPSSDNGFVVISNLDA